MHTRHRIAGLLLSTLMLCSGIATAAQTPAKAITPLRVHHRSGLGYRSANQQPSRGKGRRKAQRQNAGFSVAKGSIDDIKPDSFIGTAAVPRPTVA